MGRQPRHRHRPLKPSPRGQVQTHPQAPQRPAEGPHSVRRVPHHPPDPVRHPGHRLRSRITALGQARLAHPGPQVSRVRRLAPHPTTTMEGPAMSGLRYRWERHLLTLPIPPTTKHVALTLATYGDTNGRQIHPGEKRVATDTGLSTRAIRNHLATLREAGLIIRRSGGRSNRQRADADLYQLSIPDTTTGTPVPVVGGRLPEPDDTTTGTPVPVDNPPTTGTPVPVVTPEEHPDYRNLTTRLPEPDDTTTGTQLPPTNPRPDQGPELLAAPPDQTLCTTQPPTAVPAVVTSDDEPTTQTLIAEWIDHCTTRPPGRVIGHVSREIKQLLEEGTPYPQLRQALATWNNRGLHPSTLPSVVHELTNSRPTTRRQEATNAMFDRARELARDLDQHNTEGTP